MHRHQLVGKKQFQLATQRAQAGDAVGPCMLENSQKMILEAWVIDKLYGFFDCIGRRRGRRVVGTGNGVVSQGGELSEPINKGLVGHRLFTKLIGDKKLWQNNFNIYFFVFCGDHSKRKLENSSKVLLTRSCTSIWYERVKATSCSAAASRLPWTSSTWAEN